MLVAFLLMIGAGLRIALRTDSGFERLLATGLTVLLGVQSFIIIAGVIRLLPLTGVTLPFVSYGGSSLLANYVPARPAAAHLRRRHAAEDRRTDSDPSRGTPWADGWQADPPPRHRS